MNVPSIIMSVQKEMLKASQGPGPSQEQFVSPEPIFDPIYQLHNENPPPSADQIRPVAIFSRPEIIPHARPAPVLIEPFSGPFAELDKEVEKEIQLFRAEADKANEEALKKQIEALKNIISDQKKSVWPKRTKHWTQLQNLRSLRILNLLRKTESGHWPYQTKHSYKTFPAQGGWITTKHYRFSSFYKEIENIFHQHRLPHVLTQAENTLGPYLPGQPATHFSRVDPGHAPASPSLRRSALETRVLDRSFEILLLADGRGLFFRVEGLLFLAEFRLDVFFLPLPFAFDPFLALFPPFLLLLPAPWAGTGPPPLDSENENIYLPFGPKQNSLFETHFWQSLMNHLICLLQTLRNKKCI